jgi:glycosyltransferase involved in cell wall biosynthesis
MRFGDRVVAVSNPEKEFLLQRGFPADRLDVVTNGPNGTPREHTRLEEEDEEDIEIVKPAVVTVCGLHKRKGIDFLIRAFDQAAKAHPKWRLYIAGWGPDYDKLIALRDELGLSDRVILLRYVANPKPLLAQSDIFVLASLAEPGALSIGEARGAGCAVIGTKVGGIPEQLEYGRAGTLVEPANVEQLAAALRELMDHPAKLAEAKARALGNSERFDIRRVVTDYDEVYRRVIASFKRPVPVKAT